MYAGGHGPLMGLLYVDLLWAFLTLAHIMLDILDRSPTLSLNNPTAKKWLLYLGIRIKKQQVFLVGS